MQAIHRGGAKEVQAIQTEMMYRRCKSYTPRWCRGGASHTHRGDVEEVQVIHTEVV